MFPHLDVRYVRAFVDLKLPINLCPKYSHSWVVLLFYSFFVAHANTALLSLVHQHFSLECVLSAEAVTNSKIRPTDDQGMRDYFDIGRSNRGIRECEDCLEKDFETREQ